MKVQYDEAVDSLYLELGAQKSDGVIEIAEGVNLDTTDNGKLTGVEILNASTKVDIDTLLTYAVGEDTVSKSLSQNDLSVSRSVYTDSGLCVNGRKVEVKNVYAVVGWFLSIPANQTARLRDFVLSWHITAQCLRVDMPKIRISCGTT